MPPKFKGRDWRPFYALTCGRARLRATGGATEAFSASLRVRKMRKTLRMLIPSSSAASPLVLPASTKAKTCSAFGASCRDAASIFAFRLCLGDAFQLPALPARIKAVKRRRHLCLFTENQPQRLGTPLKAENGGPWTSSRIAIGWPFRSNPTALSAE
jgi:hypothetical protein